ncbi:hypothetical protein BDD12DRAFT_887140 [Trichophaea hybrida]|nr:hypothetical protein BDD12DRAFT_887140 [Trichophaea hybrida]
MLIEFPELSIKVLNTLTVEALRTVPQVFPAKLIADIDVLTYYEGLYAEDDDISEADERRCLERLRQLGLTRARCEDCTVLPPLPIGRWSEPCMPQCTAHRSRALAEAMDLQTKGAMDLLTAFLWSEYATTKSLKTSFRAPARTQNGITAQSNILKVWEALLTINIGTLVLMGARVRWDSRECRVAGELSGDPAVYFTSSKKFTLVFAATKSGMSDMRPLADMKGIIIETPLPPCQYALIRRGFREKFTKLNRKQDTKRPYLPPRCRWLFQVSRSIG